MAQTTNFQIDYPVSTDLVKDGASAMGTIATGFDSLLGTAGLGGFRNAIINPDFSINQRNFSSTTTSGTYGFDRWAMLRGAGGTVTYSAQTFTVGAPAATGYEARNFARIVTSGQAAVGDFALLQQGIEDVRTFAGAQIVISFWARAGSGTPSVSVEWAQSFGTGGSPSAGVESYVGKIQLSTSWTRYQIAYTVPSISGKTIGTDANSSNNILRIFTSAGSNFNARTGALGNQNATIDFWGVQVERGTRATPLERRPIGMEAALCERYYQLLVDGNTQAIGPGFSPTATTLYVPVLFRTVMRATPIISITGGTNYFVAYWQLGLDTFDSFTLSTTSPRGTVLLNTTQIATAAGAPSICYSNNASARLAFESDF